MERTREVWIAEIDDRSALVRLIRAALVHDVEDVFLAQEPCSSGMHVLQIRLASQPVCVLAGQVAGRSPAGAYTLRLRPLDTSHVPELSAIVGAGVDDAPPPSTGPMSRRAKEFDAKATMPDPEAEEVRSDELGESASYDPEVALISVAPPRLTTGADDTLTRVVTQPFSVAALTEPQRPPTLTTEMEAARAGDPSITTEMARFGEQTAESTVATPRLAHPADDEDFSVIFGNEATTPGSGTGRALGVVVRGNADDDLSLTPTVSIEPAPSTAAASQAISSGRGPRTVRRTHDVVTAGRVIANRYRIESLLGAGAVGAVYRASHVDLPRTFAIKVLHPHYRADKHLLAAFRAEARAASLLDHPNVMVVHDFGEEPDGLVYIVMEYLPGENLQAALDASQRLHPHRAIEIMLQVCAALTAAHERGIVHRDVKPDNIMLVPSRNDEGNVIELVKVCDFGIAALETGPDAADDDMTAGTPEYMAPEQAAGRADARTDVYACGIMLYEMSTGRPPFVGESAVATLAKHATEIARRPSELVAGFPPRLEMIIMRAIEKAPERRFQTMRELRLALKNVR